jgi:hypothetical protein
MDDSVDMDGPFRFGDGIVAYSATTLMGNSHRRAQRMQEAGAGRHAIRRMP